MRGKKRKKRKVGQPPSDALGTGNSKGQLLLNMYAYKEMNNAWSLILNAVAFSEIEKQNISQENWV